VVTTWVTSGWDEEQLRQRFDLSRVQRLEAQAARLGGFFEVHFATLGAIAASPIVQSGRRQEVLQYLRREKLRLGPEVEGLYLNLPDGTVIPVSGPVFSVRDRDYFQHSKAGKKWVSQVLKSRDTGNSIILLGVPIRLADGSLMGAIACALSPRSLFDDVRAIRVGSFGRAVLLDQEAQVVVGDEPWASQLSGELKQRPLPPSAVIQRRLAGAEYLLAQATVRPAGWQLVMSESYQDFLASLPQHRAINFLLLGICALLSLGVGAGLSYRELARRSHQQRELQRRLLEAEKMESLGVLAGGVAHDFNNLLASIQGFTELAREEVAQDHEAQESFRHILGACDRAKELVKRILLLCRQQEQLPEVFDLVRVIESSVTVVQPSVKFGQRVSVQHHSGQIWVEGFETQLFQVFANLLNNALQALPNDGGLVEIGSEVEVGWAKVRVVDGGHGISEANLTKIFDPLFTTRANNQGTGLGLAVVKNAVQNNGGRIEVASEPGKGSAFTVWLPLAKQPPALAAASAKPIQESGPRTQLEVLVVDDEESILTLMKAHLKRQGIKATTARSVLEARTHLQGAHRFGAVITDYSMPGESGLDLAREVSRQTPRIPVILCSGFVPELNEEQLAEAGIVCVLEKPYSFEQLKEALACFT